ncbi:BTAD domain-containing putative transcriptional regulator [Streptomyces sp. NPDC049954]|uniref:AfsR/SARP family transcriptional regulator n=1 Tax=Streptomyces sp. NPDC049954 TaxID=3155779 RepID=UPI0034168B4C
MEATVRYSVLGPVRALRGATALDTGPPKRLALLSLLLLRAPGPLTLSEAVDILWEDAPPACAVNVVHRHIGALRGTLEPGLRSRADARHLVRAADGYRLVVDASTCDLLHFRDLRARARLAVEDGEPGRGAREYVRALRLWRGPVVAAGTQVSRHPAFISVGQEFVATAKEAADVVLTAAPALTEEILTALRGAVDRHPFDEALHSRIITALAATGRQAEARRQFENISRALADELDVEPGPGLRAAHGHLLRSGTGSRRDAPRPQAQGRGGEQGPAQARAQARTSSRPAQLPPDHVPFAGRRKALRQCMELLPLEGESRPPTTTAVVCGMAGVGKTTLAVHWAHLVSGRFPDGQIHLDLRGHHPSLPPLDPVRAMCAVLDSLGVDRPPTDATGLASAFRTALASRRLLIVLDDARDCAQARPLLPASPGSLAIVTSRRRLEGLTVTDNARVVTLDPMTREEGLELLDRRLGADRIRAERPAAAEIVELCGGLPLALAVAGARALVQPRFGLASLASRLREDPDSLVALSSQDARTDTGSVFARSYAALSDTAATLFRLLSLHPSRDITARAAAALAGTGLRTARADIAELTDHHMLVEPAPGRYACHELLRTYAAALSETLDAPDVRSAARARMSEHRLYGAETATAPTAPWRSTVVLPPPRPSRCPKALRGHPDAAG